MKMIHRENLRSIGALLIAAQFAPLTIWAANRAEIGVPDGLLLWTVLVAVCGSLLWLGLWRRGLARQGTTAVAFWAVVGFSMLGLFEDTMPGGGLTLLVLLSAFCFLVYRVHHLRPFQWFQSWAVLFIALSPSTFVLQSHLIGTDQASPAHIEKVAAEFRDHQDVVLVVFDAHTSLDVLQQEFDVDIAAQYSPWRAYDPVVETDMRANYTLTHLSLASVLEMGYPYKDDARIREGDWDYLLAKISGENALVDVFKSQGYRYTVVESGWAGLHCTSVADRCVGGVWPDQGTRLAMEHSLLGPAFELTLMDTESTGALSSIRWLESELPDLLSNQEADLVFAHLMLPHPPLRLGEDCRYRTQHELGGTTVASPWFTVDEVEKRVAGYLAATVCARDVISNLLQIVEERGVLVAFGDHGSDSRAQLFRAPDDWSSDELDERFGALFVTNSRCSTGDLRSLVNLGRWLVGCLAGEEPKYVVDRFYLGGNAQRNVGASPEPLLEVTSAFVSESD